MAKLSLSLCFLLIVAAVADVNIYTDSVQSPFQDWSYASTRKASDPAQHHSGSDSYSFAPAGWGAVYLYNAAAFDTSLYSGVSFYAYFPTGASTNIEVDIIKYSSGTSNAQSPNKQLSAYLVGSSTITNGVWLQAFVNFSLFASGQYDGIWWQDKSGGSSTINVYLDDIKLVSKSGGSSATVATVASSSATVATVASSSSSSTATTAATHATSATSASVSSSSTSSTSGSTSGGGATGPTDPTINGFYSSSKSGSGTYYGAYTNGGACSLDPTPPVGTASIIHNTVAIADQEWQGSKACGLCLNVTASGSGSGGSPLSGTYIVFVNNECPSCSDGGLDFGLSGDGVWAISWIAIPCPNAGNIQFLLQGSNSYYLKLQVRNTKYPVYQVELKQSSGAYVQLVRQADNFFQPASGYGGYPLVFPLTVRITAVNGQQVVDSVASLTNGSVEQGSTQFT